MILSKEQIYAAYQNSPEVLRAYLVGPEFGPVIKKIESKYALHIDTTGSLMLLTGYMLTGLINPMQFKNELRGMGISDANTTSIMEELNENIFKPLNEKVRDETKENTGALRTPEPQKPLTGVPAPFAEVFPAPTTDTVVAENTVPLKKAFPDVVEPAPFPSVIRENPQTTPPSAPRPAQMEPFVPNTQMSPAPTSPRQDTGPKPPTPIVKTYGVDPYREQPE
ncbi:MAG: hypothetical protein WAV21_03530 [Minisyncoccia bacterium]